MTLPAGVQPVLGPIVDASGALPAATTALRDAGAISFRGGKLQKVNAAGDGWEDVPGHVISATEPSAGLFRGMLWYDTSTSLLKGYNGAAFASLGGSSSGGVITIDVGFDDEVLYEDATDQTYLAAAWNDFTVTRALTTGDDEQDLELSLKAAGINEWESYLFPADLFRELADNTGDAIGNDTWAIKTTRGNDDGVGAWSAGSGFAHSTVRLSHRSGTTWRIGSAHMNLWDRLRIRLIDVSASATGGGSGGQFLGPNDTPTEEDWENRRGKWTGRVVAPIDRAVIGVHGLVARFATINNDPVTSGFGFEQLSRTTSYADMQAARDADTHVYWEWAAAQAVEVGDFAYQGSGGTEEYSICLRAHTTAAGNVVDGAPNESAQTGWVTHSPAEVVNRTHFAGIVGSLTNVDTTGLSHGDWVASIVNDFMSLWTWTTTHNDWLVYAPSGIGSLHESGYLDNAEAATEVREFDATAPDYYLIDGKLKILIFYAAPGGESVYFTNPPNYNNPRAYFWLNDQTERSPDITYPLALTPVSGRIIFRVNGADPDESYDGGGLFYAGIVADFGTWVDAGFTLPNGRHDVSVVLWKHRRKSQASQLRYARSRPGLMIGT